MLTWLPPSLRVLKLHALVLPPCALPGPQQLPAAMAAGPGPGSRGAGGGRASGTGCAHERLGSLEEQLCAVAPVAPLPALRELYLSKCKVATLGMLGPCGHLTSLGLINCLSCSGLRPVPAALPALRSLAVVHTVSFEAEHGPAMVAGTGSGGPAAGPAAAGALAGSAACGSRAGGEAGQAAHGVPAASASAVFGAPWAGAVEAGASSSRAGGPVLGAASPPPPPLHVQGFSLPVPSVEWGSDEQVECSSRRVACQRLAAARTKRVVRSAPARPRPRPARGPPALLPMRRWRRWPAAAA